MPDHKSFVVVGVDLAGSPRRPTGVCVLRGMKAYTHVALTDEEILNSIDLARPNIVPIDAPLSLPNGRATIHDRSGEHFRDCDRELRKRGIRFFPITLGPMRMLLRNVALRSKNRSKRWIIVRLSVTPVVRKTCGTFLASTGILKDCSEGYRSWAWMD